MNLNTNGAKAIAALVVLNAGLFITQHAPLVSAHGTALRASVAAGQAQICKARTEARVAALQARLQARAAQREALRARRQMQKDAAHAATMAPSSASSIRRTTVTDYVHCLLTSGTRTVSGGV